MTIDNTLLINQPSLSVPYNTVYDVTKITNISFQAVYIVSGGASGVLKLQRSNDSIHYEDVPGQCIGINATGNDILIVDKPAYKWIKLVYTPTSGAINLSVTVLARQDTMVET